MFCPKCDASMTPVESSFNGNGTHPEPAFRRERWLCPTCGYEWERCESERGFLFCFGAEHQSFLARPPGRMSHDPEPEPARR